MIIKNFPTVGETFHTRSSTEPDTACDGMDTPCSDSDTCAPESTTCPCCGTPPLKPTELPFTATENNWMNLQQELLLNQHFQYMQTPATTLDEERSYETYGWP